MEDDPKEIETVPEPPSRVDQLIAHLKANDERYVCLVAGALFGGLAVKMVLGRTIYMIQTVNNLNGGAMPSGRLSKVIRNNTTGELWTSIAAAANNAGVHPSTMSRHVNGHTPHVRYHTYEVVGTIDTGIWP